MKQKLIRMILRLKGHPIQFAYDPNTGDRKYCEVIVKSWWKLIFSSVLILSTFACSKQEVDCDNYRSTCRYIQFSYTDCTPNGSESGWDYDQIFSDTIVSEVWGCPEKIEADFKRGLSKQGSESLKRFNQEFPSTCECE